jgi:dCTP deaminase
VTAVAFPDHALGAVLTDGEILRLVGDHRLIEPFEKGSLQLASYDMRLGPQCSTEGLHRTLKEDDPSYRLEPGQFILLTSLERLRLPKDVVARAGLISRWAQRGLISLFSPQIDPGFEGLIVVPLFNAGNGPVTLNLGETIFTVEFVRTTGVASKAWVEANNPLERIPSIVEVQMARPDFTELTDRVKSVEAAVDALSASNDAYRSGVAQRIGITGVWPGWIAAVLAVIALVVTLLVRDDAQRTQTVTPTTIVTTPSTARAHP